MACFLNFILFVFVHRSLIKNPGAHSATEEDDSDGLEQKILKFITLTLLPYESCRGEEPGAIGAECYRDTPTTTSTSHHQNYYIMRRHGEHGKYGKHQPDDLKHSI